jgi:hypothetical protein
MPLKIKKGPGIKIQPRLIQYPMKNLHKNSAWINAGKYLQSANCLIVISVFIATKITFKTFFNCIDNRQNFG